MPSSATLRADFDRLAPYDHAGWSHNSHYHAELLRQTIDLFLLFQLMKLLYP